MHISLRSSYNQVSCSFNPTPMTYVVITSSEERVS